jgi:acyl-CoA synthetase (AMP-forming)/AMP-acid ligase II
MPQGEEGEIWVSGDNVTVGYRNNPEANKESFVLMNGKADYTAIPLLPAYASYIDIV